MPSENVPSHWVYQAWQSIPQSVIDKSISKAGFDDDVKNWHISRHDTYGHAFLEGWDEADMQDVMSSLEDLVIDGAYHEDDILDE